MAVNIRNAAKKNLPGLLQARETKLNEADTVQRVLRFFVDVLGYNPDIELSRELHKQGRFLDIAVKVNGAIQLIVEVKQAGTDLQQKHLDQAMRYANEFQSWWAVLTNGTRWVLYRFVASHAGIQPFPVVDVDLAENDSLEQNLDALACLHRKEMSLAALEQIFERIKAASPKVIARALFTEEVLKILAREIRREQEILFDTKELKGILESMFSEDVQEEIGNMRVKKRKTRKDPPKESTSAETVHTHSAGEVPLAAPAVPSAEVVAAQIQQPAQSKPSIVNSLSDENYSLARIT